MTERVRRTPPLVAIRAAALRGLFGAASLGALLGLIAGSRLGSLAGPSVAVAHGLGQALAGWVESREARRRVWARRSLRVAALVALVTALAAVPFDRPPRSRAVWAVGGLGLGVWWAQLMGGGAADHVGCLVAGVALGQLVEPAARLLAEVHAWLDLAERWLPTLDGE